MKLQYILDFATDFQFWLATYKPLAIKHGRTVCAHCSAMLLGPVPKESQIVPGLLVGWRKCQNCPTVNYTLRFMTCDEREKVDRERLQKAHDEALAACKIPKRSEAKKRAAAHARKARRKARRAKLL